MAYFGVVFFANMGVGVVRIASSFEPGVGAQQSLMQNMKVPFLQDSLLLSAVWRVRGRFHNPPNPGMHQTLVESAFLKHAFREVTTQGRP